MADELRHLRAQLEQLDNQLLSGLRERQELVRNIALCKQRRGAPVRDRLREAARVKRAAAQAQKLGLDPHLVTGLMQRILEHSGRYAESLLTHGESAARHQVVVSYQGTSGAYSQMAAEQHFGPREVDLTTRGYDTFAGTLEAVASGEADYGMLPVENTTAGSITDAYDLLASTELVVVGEEVLRVQHCLVALPAAKLADIRRVYSHPQGLAQCSNFVSQLDNCSAQAFVDTAMSVVKVRDEADISQAAIASERAAMRYGLSVLARDIANQRDNFTRFMVVAREPIRYDLAIACKSSLIFATSHSQGALLQCLSALSTRELNLTKLESRPRPGKPFEYLFYLDFEGNVEDPVVRSALAELRKHTKFLKVLGSYPLRTALQPLPQATVVRETGTLPVSIGSHALGGGAPLLLVGPRAVRERAQFMGFAQCAREAGAAVLRAPYAWAARQCGDFTGPGLAAVSWMTEVAHNLEMPLASSPPSAQDVPQLVKQVDLLEVGSAQQLDFALLERVGRVDRPVLLHLDPLMSSEDQVRAAAHVRRYGNQQIVLCLAVPEALQKAPDANALAALLTPLRRSDTAPLCLAVSLEQGVDLPVEELLYSCVQAGADGVVADVQGDTGFVATFFQAATEAFARAVLG